jgi:hypothetical protein
MARPLEDPDLGNLKPVRVRKHTFPPADMTKEEIDFRNLVATSTGPDGGRRGAPQWERRICITPYGGQYHRPAGWVIVVEGSPPQGTVVIRGPDSSGWSYIIVDHATPRWVNEPQLGVVSKFLVQRLGRADRTRS